jgi:opine dehydrogenase
MIEPLSFAVIGAGPGGLGTAVRLIEHGQSVVVHDRDPERVAAVQQRGGVDLEGDIGERFVRLERVTTDLQEAVRGAQCVIVGVAADSHLELLTALLPALRPHTTLLLMAGAAGTLEAARLMREAGMPSDSILLGETATHPQASRLTGPARVRLRFPSKMRTAAGPAARTPELIAQLGDLLPMTATRNVLDPALNNPNFLIHPAPMVTNYADVERTGGELSLMNEGMTPGTLRALDAVDAEKMALQRALGLEVVSIDDFYTRAGSGPGVYRAQGEPFRMRDRIWDRYVTEDIPYGSVLYSTLGRVLGVPTPVSDGITAVLSAATGVDWTAAGRTEERLGIAGMGRAELIDYVLNGDRASVGTRG